MGFARPAKTVFTDTDLDQLEWVLSSVCSTLGPADNETMIEIRRRLFALASNGVTDPEKLREHLLMSLGRTKEAAAPA